jgi:hypothetical protein
VIGVGLELPGTIAGFALLDPLGDDWELVEGKRAVIPGHGPVTLDFALVARVNLPPFFRKGLPGLPGIPPGQAAVRGSGTRFCVSGPLPDVLPDPAVPGQTVPTTIESLLNGVVVSFHRVEPHGPSFDVGLWDNAQRLVPLYP